MLPLIAFFIGAGGKIALEINWFRQFYSPCAYFGCEICQRQTLDEAEAKSQFANDFLLKRNQKEQSGSQSARSAQFFACVARKIFRPRFFRPRRLRTRPRSSRSLRSSRKIFAARKNFSRAKIFARKFRNFSQLAEPLLAQLPSQLFRAKNFAPKSCEKNSQCDGLCRYVIVLPCFAYGHYTTPEDTNQVLFCYVFKIFLLTIVNRK